VVVTEAQCADRGGVFRGAGTRCAAAQCAPAVVGACCFRGECLIVPRALCERIGGSYRGDNTACGPDACTPPNRCPCDWNEDGRLSDADVSAFLADYFDPSVSADFDGDGVEDPDDIAAFIDCYARGCR
jgi:hypothetical protein